VFCVFSLKVNKICSWSIVAAVGPGSGQETKKRMLFDQISPVAGKKTFGVLPSE
jgi:hypothetical protein